MKPTTKAALVGAFVASAAFALVISLMARKAQAAGADGTEQYKIVSLTPYHESIPRMEQDLNNLAAQGWKIRTGIGQAIVLAR